MPDTEEIKVGDDVLTIEVRPITIICQNSNAALGPPIEYPKRVPLEPEYTLYHAERVQKLDPGFEEAWRLFHRATNPVTEFKEMPTPDQIRKMGNGAKHLMGLIDMTLKICGYYGKPVAWIHPETYMHPGWQVGLGDLAIYFANKYKGEGGVATAESPAPGPAPQQA